MQEKLEKLSVASKLLYSQVSIKQVSSPNYFEEIFHPARFY